MKRCSEEENMLDRLMELNVYHISNSRQSNWIHDFDVDSQPQGLLEHILPEALCNQIKRLVLEENDKNDSKDRQLKIHYVNGQVVNECDDDNTCLYYELLEKLATILSAADRQLDAELSTQIVALREDVDDWCNELQCSQIMTLKDIDLNYFLSARPINMLGVNLNDEDVFCKIETISMGKLYPIQWNAKNGEYEGYINESTYSKLRNVLLNQCLLKI